MKYLKELTDSSDSFSDDDSLYCPEKLSSPLKQLQNDRCIIRDITPQILPHFCCGEHDNYLSEEFWSDEDDAYIAVEKAPSPHLVFLKQIPGDLIKFLETCIGNRERGTQFEDTSSNLQTLANTKIDARGAKEIIPKIKHFETLHIPLLTLPKISATIEQTILKAFTGTQAFKCKLCCKSFSSGQALGGHTSRRHPGQSYGHS